MNEQPLTLALPTEDRKAAYDFYAALGFRSEGELAEDGVPEPLQFHVNSGLRIMFIPTGGFGWVTNNRPTAFGDQTECLLSLPAASADEVDALVDKVRSAGGRIIVEPRQQPWGYTAVFADPDNHLWQVATSP
jgi:uncharacterized protein